MGARPSGTPAGIEASRAGVRSAIVLQRTGALAGSVAERLRPRRLATGMRRPIAGGQAGDEAAAGGARVKLLSSQDSWTHMLARALVRPLIGTGVTPNHLTTLRLLSGLAACGAVAIGTRAGDLWGGVLWVLSAFLDRADGELARIGDMKSPAGHVYDFRSDLLVNSIFFLGAGVGLRHSALGGWAIPLGVIATVGMLVCWLAAEAYERLEGSGDHIWPNALGFHVDDALYLIGPMIWLGWTLEMVPAAAVVTGVMAAVTLVRLIGLRRRLARTPSAPVLER